MNLLYCVFVLKSKTTKTSEILVILIKIVLKEHTVGLTGQQRMLTPSSIAPDPCSNFCRGPCFLCSCFVFCFGLLILNTVRYQDISSLFSIDDENKRKKNNYKNSDNLSKNTLQSNVCDILLLQTNKLSFPNVLHEYLNKFLVLFNFARMSFTNKLLDVAKITLDLKNRIYNIHVH